MDPDPHSAMRIHLKGWIRICIQLKGWIRICIHLKGWIRICIQLKGWIRICIHIKGWFSIRSRRIRIFFFKYCTQYRYLSVNSDNRGRDQLKIFFSQFTQFRYLQYLHHMLVSVLKLDLIGSDFFP
jgi:hypothetical protein